MRRVVLLVGHGECHEQRFSCLAAGALGGCQHPDIERVELVDRAGDGPVRAGVTAASNINVLRWQPIAKLLKKRLLLSTAFSKVANPHEPHTGNSRRVN
jgi:hypothetical protein